MTRADIYLVKLQANQSCDNSCRRSDGGNDLSGYLFRLVAISDRNVVVRGPKI